MSVIKLEMPDCRTLSENFEAYSLKAFSKTFTSGMQTLLITLMEPYPITSESVKLVELVPF